MTEPTTRPPRAPHRFRPDGWAAHLEPRPGDTAALFVISPPRMRIGLGVVEPVPGTEQRYRVVTTRPGGADLFPADVAEQMAQAVRTSGRVAALADFGTDLRLDDQAGTEHPIPEGGR